LCSACALPGCHSEALYIVKAFGFLHMYYPQSLTHSNMLNAFSNLHAPVREKMLFLMRFISRPALRAHLSDQYQNICAKHLLMKTLFKPTSKSTSFSKEFAFITRKNSLSIKCATFLSLSFPRMPSCAGIVISRTRSVAQLNTHYDSVRLETHLL
jgi:hypothetical protein